MSELLKVGIVGCGSIAQKHFAAFLEIPQVKVTALVSRNSQRALALADGRDIAIYPDYETLFREGDVDAVSICTPSGLHGEAAVAAAGAGKHVIVEKPPEVTLEKVDAMIGACEKAGVQLHCIFNNRYRPGNRFLKQAVEAGRFGRLLSANAHVRWYRTPEYFKSADWRGTWALDGGGALMNQSIHFIDLLLWFAGDVRQVCGFTGTLLHQIETEDTAVAALEFANGALGTIIATTSTYPGYPSEIQLTGERGSAVIQNGMLSAWNFRDEDPLDLQAKDYMGEMEGGTASDPTALSHKNHKTQLEESVTAILSGGKPAIDGHEARKAVELIHRIYQSSRQHRQ